MLNIPTDLLRTLITVVDLRSFTKAAQSLGVTQPAVSAQIKRLQSLLGYDLLDKRTPGVSLTPRGEIVVNQARRLLSINDEILQVDRRPAAAQDPARRHPRRLFRLAHPGDARALPPALARYQLHRVEQRDLRQPAARPQAGRSRCRPGGHHHRADDQAAPHVDAAGGLGAQRRDPARPERPVPLVCYGEDCACQRVAVAALREAGRECEFVFTSRSLMSLAAAVAAGFGVMVMPRGRARKTDLHIWEDAPLPKLPELYCGIFVREGGNRTALEELADNLAADLRAEPQKDAPATVAPMRASKAV